MKNLREFLADMRRAELALASRGETMLAAVRKLIKHTKGDFGVLM
jgi:hypothetical protein